MRIHKAISAAGAASRRAAEEMIKAGRVKVNGHPAFIGQDIIPGRDVVTIDNDKIDTAEKKKHIYIMLNKPRGYVTTLKDEQGRRCVAELVEAVGERVYPIGRLDKNSEGLLLLTNDGNFANIIMHPRSHIGKLYRVTIRPDITDEQAAELAAGVMLDGERTLPADVRVLTKEPGRVVLEIKLFEGRNRQIRRMCEAVGLEIVRLRRTAIGPVKLGMLKPGTYRELTKSELSALIELGTKG